MSQGRKSLPIMPLGEVLHGVVVCCEQVGHLLIELSEMILDHTQLFQDELQQPTVHRMQRRTRLEGIASQSCSGVARRRGAASVARTAGSASPSASACSSGHVWLLFDEAVPAALVREGRLPHQDMALQARHCQRYRGEVPQDRSDQRQSRQLDQSSVLSGFKSVGRSFVGPPDAGLKRTALHV